MASSEKDDKDFLVSKDEQILRPEEELTEENPEDKGEKEKPERFSFVKGLPTKISEKLPSFSIQKTHEKLEEEEEHEEGDTEQDSSRLGLIRNLQNRLTHPFGEEKDKKEKEETAEEQNQVEEVDKPSRFSFIKNLPSRFTSQKAQEKDEEAPTESAVLIYTEDETQADIRLPVDTKASYFNSVDPNKAVVPVVNQGALGVYAGWAPLILECPNCHCIVKTATVRRTGAYACFVFFVFVLLGFLFCCLPWCCSLCPFCNRSYKDVEHYCPKCNACLGRYKRQQWFCC